ncbi:PilX N-terminal domain-containing pilus assembly protein [Variovorax sp. J22P240]|uniref:pilus assembly PilX family protein n=1 Tax=Variovorax sp. J22P240 TaxID=3053514 RepID=UPI002578EE0D|nr:PilX N-terminal domain-containing pilus assembly protein [Variovorax sp. J22P240]MDM0001280.1 PilX N-terminal domain-containing pilus assembly protein [Variovorax sp. J22P240]
MSPRSTGISGMHRHSGFSLIVVLLLLVVVSVLGIGAAQLSLVNELGARNDRDVEIAFQAAEAALIDAELDVLGPNTNGASRLCAFNNKDVTPFVAGCGGPGAQQGLCALAEVGAIPAWMKADLSPESRTSVVYGTFTGQQYATGRGAMPAAPPRYVIEVMRSNGGWEANSLQSASARNSTNIFRVTAMGFGVRKETQVVLQTNLYKPRVSTGCP